MAVKSTSEREEGNGKALKYAEEALMGNVKASKNVTGCAKR